MKKLILASASPRRKELLEKMGIDFTVDPSVVEEDLSLPLPAHELARVLATLKAQEVSSRYEEGLILAADTLVVLGEERFGKPAHAEEALEMLKKLNGKIHEVITGFTLLDAATGRAVTHSVTTFVHFKRNTERALERYAKSGEPMDKAGAYAIQGAGGELVDRIEGDYDNVVGLPTSAVVEALERFK